MEYTAKLPTEVGLYRHRWDFRGQMREQVLFVGYTNARAPRLQGSEPNAYMPRKMKCCKPDEHLHADRLTPKEWGGWWARIETPNMEFVSPCAWHRTPEQIQAIEAQEQMTAQRIREPLGRRGL